MSLSMNDVLQYLASSGAEEEAEKQLGLQSNPTIAQDLQIRSIRETLAEKQKARHDEFLQKLVQQANLVNVDVLAQEKQLAELEALEQQLREEQLAFEMEKQAIAEEVERLNKLQTRSLIDHQKEALLQLQKKKLELEEAAKEKEQAVKEMTEKLEQEERERIRQQQERDQRLQERSQPARSNLLELSRGAAVDAAEKIAQARAEAKAIQDELEAVTTQVQRLNDPAFIATTATAPIPTTEELQVSDPDLERVEVAIGELKSKWKENESQRGSGRSNPNSMLGLQAEDTLQRFVDRWLEDESTAAINIPNASARSESTSDDPNRQPSAAGVRQPVSQQPETAQTASAMDDQDALVQLIQSLKQEIAELKAQQTSRLPPEPQHDEQQNLPQQQPLGFPPNYAPPGAAPQAHPYGMLPHPQMPWQWPYPFAQFPPAPYPYPLPTVPAQQQTGLPAASISTTADVTGSLGEPPTAPSDSHVNSQSRGNHAAQSRTQTSPKQRWRQGTPSQALLRLEQQHLEQMTKIEFEMEKLDRQQQLQELRQRLDRDKHARQQEEEHEQWLLEQKRQLQTLRVQQALQRERQLLERTMQQTSSPSLGNTGGDPSKTDLEDKWNAAGVFQPHAPWDPSQGIAVFVDGVSLSNTSVLGVAKLRLSAGILQVGGAHSQISYLARISATDWMDADDAGVKRDRYWCATALRKETNKVAAGQRVLLAVEVQGQVNVEQESQRTAVGWSYAAPIVNDALRVGLWKVKLLAGGVSQATLTSSTAAAPDPPASAELGCVYFRLLDPSEAARAAQFVPAINADDSMYLEFGTGESPFEQHRSAPAAQPQPQASKQIAPLSARDPVASPVARTPTTKPQSRPPSSQYSFRMESRQRSPAQSRMAQSALQRPPSSYFFEEAMSEPVAAAAVPDRLATEHWLPGVINPGASSPYEKGDAIDIYVDAARFLPDSCTITRLVVRALTADAEIVGQVCEGFSPLTSSVVSPSFNVRMELREDVFNMTTTLLLRVDTLEVATLYPVCVGYSALKLFVDGDGAQPAESGAQGCCINEGNFQLPLTAMRPSLANFCENSVQSFVRIPCASLLVRVVCAPKSADGLSVLSRANVPERQWQSVGLDKPAPPYSAGQYDGSLCAPTQEEVLAFANKASSDVCNLTVDNRVRQRLAEIEGPEALSMSAKRLEDAARGRFPPYDDMRGVMTTAFVAEYNRQAGLRVGIDALANLPDHGVVSKGYLTKVIYSLAPPGLYYRQPPLTEGVQFTRSIDPERPWQHPVFRDGFHTFSQLALDEASCVVLDVRHIRYDQRKGVQVEPPDRKRGFWALFPIMTSMFGREDTVFEKRYVASGAFQLPLIEGAVQQDILQHSTPWQEMLRRLALPRSADGALRLAEGVSILVRIADAQISVLHQKHSTELPADQIDQFLLRKMIEAASQATRIKTEKYALDLRSAGKPVSSLFAKGEDAKKVLKEVNKAFAEATGVNHYVF